LGGGFTGVFLDIFWLKDDSLGDLENFPDSRYAGPEYCVESGGWVGEFQADSGGSE